jgi:hypothetical protein
LKKNNVNFENMWVSLKRILEFSWCPGAFSSSPLGQLALNTACSRSIASSNNFKGALGKVTLVLLDPGAQAFLAEFKVIQT